MKGHRIVKDRDGNLLEVHAQVGGINTITKYHTNKPVAAPKPSGAARKKRRRGLNNAITS
jgi:hypothetical protein